MCVYDVCRRLRVVWAVPPLPTEYTRETRELVLVHAAWEEQRQHSAQRTQIHESVNRCKYPIPPQSAQREQKIDFKHAHLKWLKPELHEIIC